jgi:hypothetical protein
MAEIKVLNKQNYELTLSSEEKEVLENVVGRMHAIDLRGMLGITDQQFDVLGDIRHVLIGCQPK